MKTILANIVPEETRIAVLDEAGELESVEYERSSQAHLVGNIYRGKVQNVLPGMQAAFVDIGAEKNAFLYIGDGLPPEAKAAGAQYPKQKIHVGQVLPVQITKDAVGSKGPRATLHISLPGRLLVLVPTASYIGLSRRLADAAERERLHGLAAKLLPEGMGLIVRTAAAGASEKRLSAEVQGLVQLWQGIMARFRLKGQKRSSLLYRDADLLIRVVRDSLTEDVGKMVIDNAEAYGRASELARALMPELAERVQLYEERQPLFQAYQVEQELEKLGARQVELISGGFLVIDKTEALTVIDVNTGKYVGQSNLADTVYQANLEAAAEIMKQIRLRDLGGIIICDFIDMETEAQKESLLQRLRELAEKDRTKMSIVDITSLGLVEITRKKSRANLESLIYAECPICHGCGRVESPETVSIRISRDIRRMERKSHAEAGYELEVHPHVAEELQQNQILMNLSAEFGLDLKVTARPEMHPESYSIMQQS